ncbi:acyl CoA:acetate/3-ketoacid CoA transferase [Youngiibacter multivorans]|uniref:Propionate CoA-transferase n=1 Tax=Youngiibacter multivorans TaxID=937251 RepID=A0ABS4G7I4_9CLOT|nr:CoA-transferase [Youngiibacter multivorans]MBP1920489.1 propionate CoA-transferase [Youngiibacter multivorans]
MNKLTSAKDAIELIKDGDVVAISGFMLATAADEIYATIEEKFLTTGSPKSLTLYQAAGISDYKTAGTLRLTHEGLLKRYVTGHFANNQAMISLVNNNKIECYNLPQGVICHLYRAAAAGKVGEITKVGLNTYMDPRQLGAKMNSVTTENIVELIDVLGEEHLLYKAPKFNIGLVRGTTADEHGNISFEEESSYIDALDVAMAVKACGGKVIAQVKNYVKSESMQRNKVHIPGVFVDKVVVCSDVEKHHRMTPGTVYDPVLAGYYKKDVAGFKGMALDNRKIIARRAAMELNANAVVNLGIGIPEGVASVASEEGFGNDLVLTIESGLIGGIPQGGNSFGSAVNSWASLPMTSQFDFYNGGGLDVTFLGFAEIDPKGNINVSKFGPKIAGCGGFIDISQCTKKIVFCGTLTAGGLVEEIVDGKLVIVNEGKQKKFLHDIEQITFSAEMVARFGQEVLIVTERCVFKYGSEGLTLIEVAPGIDIEKDIIGQMAYKPMISENLKTMDARLFSEAVMGLKDELK